MKLFMRPAGARALPFGWTALSPWGRSRTILCALLALAVSGPGLLHAATPRVHAIVGARIVTAPGQMIERGTIVMRDGVITAVGARVPVPADARIWDGDSLTVYPGMIDAYVSLPEPTPAGRESGPQRPAESAASRGASHELGSVRPEMRAATALPLAADRVEALRAAGFTAVQVAPSAGILRGQSVVIGLEDADPGDAVIRADAAQVIALQPERQGYPGSLMGAIAVVRQAFLDARWHRDVHATYARSPQGRERPEVNLSLQALEPLVAGRQSALFVTDDMLEVLRAAAVAREGGITTLAAVGGGDEYKRAKEIAASGMSLVIPVQFPEAPDVSDPDLALEVTTEELRHWNQAPGNAAALARHKIPFAFTTHGLKEAKSFRPNVSRAIARGLDPAAALAAVTTTPARLLGLSDRLGTLAPGKIANLTVTRGDLFAESGKVREVWVDGRRYETARDDGWKGRWTLGHGNERHDLIVGVDRDTSVKLVVGSDTLRAFAVRLEDDRMRFRVQRGNEPVEDFDLSLRHEIVRGTLGPAPGAERVDLRGTRLPEKDTPERVAKSRETLVAVAAVPGISEAWRVTQPAQPAAVLVRNATVWTAGPQGTLESADVLVRAGKIAAVGRNLSAPSGATVIDGTGKHVVPGIIDEHSHSAILGNVNECTNSVTCEARIQDVVNSESVQLYRQLAGGTTILHLLHGSCNAIGGQCAVIKNRWGESPDRLIYTPAPPTVKFALGENPKQSNWGADATGRYPQTRAGVEQVIRDAFTRARDYQAAFAEHRQGRRPLPPRRDLQLDALVEIVEGKRLIHCHAYRQDEMLMLMRLAEEFGFKVNTFTHIQEAYKIADEMAAHGASAIGFSDWWAYKYEVIDGIPWNGYLLWDRGVNVGFNSDDSELARRLNTEAAKAVKYGGVPPQEAIRFVTLNPAKSLGIDDRVGSLEPGKDADFSIWSGSPLSYTSTCEQTWVEGRKYFDRAADLAGRAALDKERAELIAAARAAKKDDKAAGPTAGRAWPPRYLQDADISGNSCGNVEMPFLSETERRARRGEER
jgi:imidazolonepropionase-like amidohydrolase